MNKLEKILGLLIILLLVLKLFLIPYIGVLLTLSTSLLVLLYFPFGFALFNNIRFRNILKKESYNGISTLRIIGSIATGIGFSFMIIGILFKSLSWGTSDKILKTSLYLILIVLIILLIRFLKSKDVFYKMLLIRVLIIGGLEIILLVV